MTQIQFLKAKFEQAIENGVNFTLDDTMSINQCLMALQKTSDNYDKLVAEIEKKKGEMKSTPNKK